MRWRVLGDTRQAGLHRNQVAQGKSLNNSDRLIRIAGPISRVRGGFRGSCGVDNATARLLTLPIFQILRGNCKAPPQTQQQASAEGRPQAQDSMSVYGRQPDEQFVSQELNVLGVCDRVSQHP